MPVSIQRIPRNQQMRSRVGIIFVHPAQEWEWRYIVGVIRNGNGDRWHDSAVFSLFPGILTLEGSKIERNGSQFSPRASPRATHSFPGVRRCSFCSLKTKRRLPNAPRDLPFLRRDRVSWSHLFSFFEPSRGLVKRDAEIWLPIPSKFKPFPLKPPCGKIWTTHMVSNLSFISPAIDSHLFQDTSFFRNCVVARAIFVFFIFTFDFHPVDFLETSLFFASPPCISIVSHFPLSSMPFPLTHCFAKYGL